MYTAVIDPRPWHHYSACYRKHVQLIRVALSCVFCPVELREIIGCRINIFPGIVSPPRAKIAGSGVILYRRVLPASTTTLAPFPYKRHHSNDRSLLPKHIGGVLSLRMLANLRDIRIKFVSDTADCYCR